MKKLVFALTPLLDIFLVPFVFVSSLIMLTVRKAGIQRLDFCRSLLLRVGVFPIYKHYYEPLFDVRMLQKPLNENRLLPGIEWNIAGQLALLKEFNYNAELERWASAGNGLTFSLENNSFRSGDAEYWYNVIRHFKPKKIVEVGSGNSTLVAIKAIAANKAQDAAYQCRHICIEPYEVPWLEKTDVQVIRQRLEDIDRKLFDELEANDILFIDSSHIIRPQGDVLVEYLEILPMLNEGVIVHVHDIFSPKDYPEDWLKNRIRFWNEQYLLEGFLTGNRQWEIIGALNFLHHQHADALKAKCIFITPEREPGSFYMRRIHQD